VSALVRRRKEPTIHLSQHHTIVLALARQRRREIRAEAASVRRRMSYPVTARAPHDDARRVLARWSWVS
jgi:hypothetical protein